MSQRQIISDASVEFASNFYKALLFEMQQQPENLVFSPYALHTLLGMLLVGADGKTKRDLLEALNFSGIGDTKLIASSYQLMTTSLQNAGSPNTFTMYNIRRIYYCKGIKLKESYLKSLNDYFFAEMEQLDFSTEKKRNVIVNKINGFISNRTNKRFKKFLNTDQIDENTRILIVSAMYFRGRWVRGFKKKNTCQQPFQNADGIVQVSMMSIQHMFPYAVLDEIDATAVVIPYLGGTVSMVVFLPNSVDGFSQEFLDGTLTIDRKRFHLEVVHLQLPKFQMMTASNKICRAVKKLGMKRLFSEKHCNLSSAIEKTDEENMPKLFVNQIIHKTLLLVDEDGGAFEVSKNKKEKENLVLLESQDETNNQEETVFVNPKQIRYFIADHPFYFQIVDHENDDLVLFAGHCIHPESTNKECSEKI